MRSSAMNRWSSAPVTLSLSGGNSVAHRKSVDAAGHAHRVRGACRADWSWRLQDPHSRENAPPARARASLSPARRAGDTSHARCSADAA